MTPQEEKDILLGYTYGFNISEPFPDSSRSPYFIHGFRVGRDDIECAKGIRKFPSRTPVEASIDLKSIDMMVHIEML